MRTLATIEVDLGHIWVKGVSTKELVDGKAVSYKGTFLVEGPKTYRTATGATKTVPVIYRIDDVSTLLELDTTDE